VRCAVCAQLEREGPAARTTRLQREAGGVQARAARRLGISRSNLNYRIGRLGIRLQEIRFE